MTDARHPPKPTDNAFLGKSLYGGTDEPTFAGALSFARRRYTRDLAGVDAVVWGIPFDAATSNRPGARFGPSAIREASSMLEGDPHYPFAIDIFQHLAVVDYGDCGFDYGRPWEVAGHIREQAGAILDAGCRLVSLGGDHFVTWPLLEAHAARHGPLALVQFDAHQDTWPDDGERVDHGTFVGRAVKAGVIDPARSIQVGIRTHAPETFGIEIVGADEVAELGVAGVAERIRRRVGGAKAYLTFDIDCLDPACAPGTGTPVIGGLTTREARMMLIALGDIDFVGADVVEVAPVYDVASITALAGATVAVTWLGLLLQRRRRAQS